MPDIAPKLEIRNRIRDLNTKAYYLLVAFSFVYVRSPESRSLKLALTLTAITAVLPVQDYIESSRWLECLRTAKVICLAAALLFAIFWIWEA
jgi:hypothetical protein